MNYAHDIIGNLNAGMEKWIDWNFCVDENGGPRHVDFGFSAGMIVSGGAFHTNLIFDYVGHFSRYIRPGAQRAICFKISGQVILSPAGRPSIFTPMAAVWLPPKMDILILLPQLEDIGNTS